LTFDTLFQSPYFLTQDHIQGVNLYNQTDIMGRNW